MTKMETIKNKEQLEKNINTLESYLTNGDDYDTREATLLIKRGTCFVAYYVDEALHFAPSRFIGYKDNNLDKHTASSDKDGRITNPAINEILKSKPLPDEDLNLKYFEYCNKLGVQPSIKGSFGVERKFWRR